MADVLITLIIDGLLLLTFLVIVVLILFAILEIISDTREIVNKIKNKMNRRNEK